MIKIIMSIFVLSMNMFCCSNMAATEPLRRAPDLDPVGKIENRDISEASGMVASTLNRDVLWVINDSGNWPKLFAMTGNGRNIGAVIIENVRNIDWEDLSSFRFMNESYLLIADVGDNNARREFYSLHIIREPKIKQGKIQSRTLQVERTLLFQYEDGPKDCESVAVDASAQRVLLLTKRTHPPVLYEIPLSDTSNKILKAKIVTPVTIPQPTEKDLLEEFGNYSSQPTAMDIHPAGTSMVVLTYKHAYLYDHDPGQSWEAAFSKLPRKIDLSSALQLYQKEAVCFHLEGKAIFVTSEGIHSPLYRLDINE